MYCLLCGYDLSRTPDERCSECGTAFDPGVASTYAESPGVLHRLLRRAPRLRAWYIEHCASTRCSCCGRAVSDNDGSRCPSCNSRLDVRDPTTVVRVPSFVPRVLTRLRHGSLLRGVLVPACLVVLALGCISGWITPKIPARRHGWLEFTDWGAVCVGVGLLGAALFLNARFWWNRIEPFWRIAPLFATAGAVIGMGAWIAAIVWALRQYLF